MKKFQKSVVILAGGMGSRMGYKDKAFLEYKNKEFIHHILEKVEKFDEIIIVSNDLKKYKDFDKKIKIIEDKIKGIGPLGGIYTALQDMKNPHALILSCDTPFLDKEFIDYLGSYKENKDVTIPRYIEGDRKAREPLCSLYSKTILKELKSQINEKIYKIGALFNKVNVNWIEIDDFSNSKEIIKGFSNINTSEDLEKIGGIYGEKDKK